MAAIGEKLHLMTDTSPSRRKEPDINQQAPLFINCVQQGWRTSGMRAIDGMRHNIFGMPVIKMTARLYLIKHFFRKNGTLIQKGSPSLEYSNRAKSIASYFSRPLQKDGLIPLRLERGISLEVSHQRNRLERCKQYKTGYLINGVVSPLWMKVASVPQAILNARGWRERSGHGFFPVTSQKGIVTVVLVVWGSIILKGRTEPIFDSDSVTGDRYCAEVVFPNVRMFRGAIGPDFVFMDDNPRPYQNADVKQLLESEDITRLD
ncbi:transposable element Tcb2 transposase [Trichonephila clavipes]|nr:transposable element Tcb2 transposase [Trichonephila clavipes]